MLKTSLISSLVLCLLLLSFRSANAQSNKITGIVKTVDSIGIGYANVILKKQADNKIIAFKATDANGYFSFGEINNSSDESLYLEVSHLSFNSKVVTLKNGVYYYDIVLQMQPTELKEIAIHNKPKITTSGDTVSYRVDEFAGGIDRTIGDVLERMPGFEVRENGRILYQGQAISSLYIDGTDLLGSRYGIGTKSIPHAIVLGVEVLNNHQPIKVLKDRVMTNDIAVNLEIKESAKMKLTGDAKIGIGPENYLGEINSMMLNKEFKFLNVLKGNNIGVDLRDDSQDLLESRSDDNFLFNLGTQGAPNITKERYFRNNSLGILTNNLFELGRDWQLRSNIDVLYDRNKIDYRNNTTVYATDDSVFFEEDLSSKNKPFTFNLSEVIIKNTDNNYFKNTLKFNYLDRGASSTLASYESLLNQDLARTQYKFSNEFRYIPLLKNDAILTFEGGLNGTNTIESLMVSPGRAIDFLDTLGVYENIEQDMHVYNLDYAVGARYIPLSAKISQTYEIDLYHQRQQLASQIGFVKPSDSFEQEGNDLHWKKSFASFKSQYFLKTKRNEWRLTLPLTFHSINVSDKLYQFEESKSTVTFDPSFVGRIRISNNSEATVLSSYSNFFSDPYDMFRGPILTNYRTLMTNDAAIQHSKLFTSSLKFKTGNPVKMLFFNVSYNFSRFSSNTIRSFVVEDKVTRSVLVANNNSLPRHTIKAGVDKFIFGLGAKSGINATYSISRQNQIVNQEMFPYLNARITISPNINMDVSRTLSFRYRSDFSWWKSEPVNFVAGKKRKALNFSQFVRIYYSPSSLIDLGIKAHQIYNKSAVTNTESNYLFLDVDFRYKLEKLKTDIHIKLNNLTNIKSFDYSVLDYNTFFSSAYKIRGRTLLLTAIYTF